MGRRVRISMRSHLHQLIGSGILVRAEECERLHEHRYVAVGCHQIALYRSFSFLKRDDILMSYVSLILQTLSTPPMLTGAPLRLGAGLAAYLHASAKSQQIE